jgi:hypothetical protein
LWALAFTSTKPAILSIVETFSSNYVPKSLDDNLPIVPPWFDETNKFDERLWRATNNSKAICDYCYMCPNWSCWK